MDNFWRKVSKNGPNDCWLWTASTVRGYGHVSVMGVLQYAHRVSWGWHNGTIPPGMCVLHRCDNRGCVNPTHLFLGTYKDNNADRARKGRNADKRGKRNGRAVLTEAQVIAIRVAVGTQTEIARRYGVSRTAIRRIKRREGWSHI